jgi:integrase
VSSGESSRPGRTQRGFSETTRREYERPIEQHVLPRWRTWQLADVEPADVRELFRELLDEGVSVAGIKKVRAALSVLFATADEDKRLARSNPIAGVRVPSAGGGGNEPEPRARALTQGEVALVLRALPSEWRLLFEFLTHTGLRISEAVGLTWAHVELGARPRVLVREQVYRGERKRLKSGHGRRDVPLPPGLAERLRARRRDLYIGEDAPVFASPTGGTIDPSRLRRRVLDPAATSAGLGSFGFHVFRHTCASLLFAHGRNVKVVQEWLGHHSPSFTLDTYVHLIDGGLGAADFLDELVRPAQVGNGGATQATETDGAAQSRASAQAAV